MLKSPFIHWVFLLLYKLIHRRPDPFRFKRNSGEFEAHLDGSEGSQEHRGIEVPEVSDAEDLSLDFSKAVAQWDIEIFEYDFPELISVVTFGHPHRGQGITVLMSIQGIQFKIPALDRLKSGPGKPSVTCKNMIQAYLSKQGQGFLQAVKQVGRRSVGKYRLFIGLQHLLPIPIFQ